MEIFWFNLCYFRLLFFFKGCIGNIRFGDGKEKFKISVERVKFENVEVIV